MMMMQFLLVVRMMAMKFPPKMLIFMGPAINIATFDGTHILMTSTTNGSYIINMSTCHEEQSRL